MKLTHVDEITDEIIGKSGTLERNKFEYELQMDVIGTIIREARLSRKMTQEDLGNLLGVQKAQISKLENNTKDFRIGTILKVLEALGAKVTLNIELEDRGFKVA